MAFTAGPPGRVLRFGVMTLGTSQAEVRHMCGVVEFELTLAFTFAFALSLAFTFAFSLTLAFSLAFTFALTFAFALAAFLDTEVVGAADQADGAGKVGAACVT